MIISSCFLSESDSESDYWAEFGDENSCNKGEGNKLTAGKWYDDSGMYGKNIVISDDFRDLQKFVKKNKNVVLN